MEETTTEPVAPKLSYSPALYSTWRMKTKDGMIYLMVWHITFRELQPVRYTVLRLFETEFRDWEPAHINQLIDNGYLVEWKMPKF